VSQKESNQKLAREELWVDYIEDDLDPSLKEDLELVLDNSSQERRHLETLKLARAVAKVSGPAIEPKSDPFFAQLEQTIMSRLDEKLDDNVVVLPVRRWFVPAAAAIVLLVVGSLVWKNLQKEGVSFDRKSGHGDLLVSTSAQDLDSFSDSLINDQNEGDFFVEVAAQKMKTLSQDETASFFNRLKE